MKMKKLKKFIMLSFVVSSLSISTNILTYANTTENFISTENKIDELNKPSTRKSYVPVDEDLNSNTTSQILEFTTSNEYCYYRLYVQNNSNVDYVVVSPSGKSNIVKAKSNGYLWSTGPTSAGTKTVSVTSKDGSKLNGHIAIRVADNLEEVEM